MADNSFVRILPGDASGGFQWLPDGSALLAASTGADNLDNFIRIPIDGGPRTTVSHFSATDSIFMIAVTRDGRIAFSRGTSEQDVVLLTLPK
jgi:hypothetical protein